MSDLEVAAEGEGRRAREKGLKCQCKERSLQRWISCGETRDEMNEAAGLSNSDGIVGS